MAKCISNLKNKAALDTQKGTSLGVKCVRMHLAAGLRPDPLGSLSAPPDPLAAIGGGCPLLIRGEGNGKMEGRGWQGGREEGEEGKGRTPVPDYESAKVATLKCGGPPTMPEENRGP